MASFTPSYTYANLVTLADNMVAGVATSGIDVTAIDWIDGLFWAYNAYPWRWSTKSFTAIALANATQDFTCTDTDVLQPLSGRIVRTDQTADPKDVGFVRWIEPVPSNGASKVSFPNFGTVSYVTIADANKIRMPALLNIPSGQTLQFQGEYKKNHTKLTATSSTIVFPDHYIHVFVQGLIWVYYKFTRDKRAGTLELVRGIPVYTGALGEFMDAMQWCAQQEDFGKADTRFPDESIGATPATAISIFGAF